MTNVTLESPLVNIARLGKRELVVDGRSCWLDEIALLDMVNLRGDASDPAFASAVLSATGLALPVVANTASVGNGRQLFWLGPDEWLLKTAGGTGDAIEAALRGALVGKHISVVQVGSGNTTFSLHGAAAADLISRGCPLDLHARAFPNGSLAQSHISKANVVLYCLKAETSFEITVRRSFAEYLFKWLCEAGS
ncbi:MAG: sarcosine oxidase subunit gamma [Rhodoferax sp.]|nr:sarcosine oxidase subunit gamma [Rhodoferax sp.]